MSEENRRQDSGSRGQQRDRGGRRFSNRRQGQQQQSQQQQSQQRWHRGKRRCQFCTEKAKTVDYKSPDMLRRFLSDRGKIRPRRQTGTCARHQRQLARAVKRARYLALLPYTPEHSRRY
ncbi:MAG: 30S ribosomal protein S18 [Anaerolineae bacterium]|nr:30S ribosomal protein S18 [Anaerolineae bacterium]